MNWLLIRFDQGLLWCRFKIVFCSRCSRSTEIQHLLFWLPSASRRIGQPPQSTSSHITTATLWPCLFSRFQLWHDDSEIVLMLLEVDQTRFYWRIDSRSHSEIWLGTLQSGLDKNGWFTEAVTRIKWYYKVKSVQRFARIVPQCPCRKSTIFFVILFCSIFFSHLLNQLFQQATVWSIQHELLFETFSLNDYSMTLDINEDSTLLIIIQHI